MPSSQVEFEDLADHGLDDSLSSRVWSALTIEILGSRADAVPSANTTGYSQFTYASQQPDYDPDKNYNVGAMQYYGSAATSASAVQPAPTPAVTEAYQYQHTMTVEEEERYENERFVNQGGRRGRSRLQFL